MQINQKLYKDKDKKEYLLVSLGLKANTMIKSKAAQFLYQDKIRKILIILGPL